MNRFLHRFLILSLTVGGISSCTPAVPPPDPTPIHSVSPQPQAQTEVHGGPSGHVPLPTLPPLPAAPASRAEAEVLALVNELRTKGTLNGDASVRGGTCAATFVPRPPLGSAAPLAAAAKAHANYVGFNPYSGHSQVAGRPYFSGTGPAERLQAAHLPSDVAGLWPHLTAWAETVAYGYAAAPMVVAAWLASAPHCAALMNPDMTHVGVAYMDSSVAINHHVWVQVFATYR